MKIAVLGARGFVGSRLTKSLGQKHNVIPVFRQTIDLLDYKSVQDFLRKEKFDVIVNAAAIMTDPDSLTDTRNNLGIFMNFYHNSELFGKFVNLASAAEYDRSTDINLIQESEIFTRLPKDSYGFGQNIKSRLSLDKNNFYNIRIFNCFGKGEYESRIFTRYLNQGKLEITNNRYFDYFSINDLCHLVDHCIVNHWTIRDVNAVYTDKYLISEVIELFCATNRLDSNFSVISFSQHNYTGSAANINTLNIKFNGLIQGFRDYTLKE